MTQARQIVGPSPDKILVRVPVTMHWLWAPLGLFVLLPVPALVWSLLVPQERFMELFGQPSFIDFSTRLLIVAYSVLIFLIFLLFVPMRAQASASINLTARDLKWVDRTIRVLALITFAAYIVWFVNAVIRGLDLPAIQALVAGEQGAAHVLRGRYFENLGGVTTWMQLGSLLAALSILRARTGGKPAKGILIPLFVVAMLRAALNSERLALIEIGLATVIAILVLRPEAPKALRSVSRSLWLMLLAWLGLVLVFGVFEFFRSWTYQKGIYDGNLWDYTVNLLLGYYTTALNLAAFDREMLNGELLPSAFLQGSIWQQIFGPSPISGAQSFYGLETYTNRSGILVPYVAFGRIGGAILLGVTAVLLSLLARGVAKGNLVAFVIYCSTAVAVLEIVRIYYFGSSRALPLLAASAVMWISWSLMRSRQKRALAVPQVPAKPGFTDADSRLVISRVQ